MAREKEVECMSLGNNKSAHMLNSFTLSSFFYIITGFVTASILPPVKNGFKIYSTHLICHSFSPSIHNKIFRMLNHLLSI